MATLGRWTGSGAYFPTTSWSSPNGLFGTQARNDGSAYSFNATTSTLTLPSSDLADGYLLIARVHTDCSHNNRNTNQDRILQTVGTGNFANLQAGSYERNNNNDEQYSLCMAFVDGPSASAQFQYSFRREVGDGTPAGAVTRASFDVIPFYYSDIGIYTSTTAELLGGTTPNAASIATTTLEGTNITRSGTTVSVTGDNKRYVVLGSHYSEGRSGRTQRWVGPIYDGTLKRSATSYQYWRDAGTDNLGVCFSDIMETATATRTIQLGVYRGDGVAANQGGADVDGSTPSAALNTLVVIELNDSAEVFKTEDGTGGQDLIPAAITDLNISRTTDIEFNDSASWTRASDTAMNAEQAMDALVGATAGGAYNSASSSTRATGRCDLTVNGTEDADVYHGGYGRGNQSSTDTFGYSANPVGFVALSSGDDVGFSVVNEGDQGPVDSQADWVGAWGINLDTMEAAGGTNTDVTPGAGSVALTGQVPTVSLTNNQTVQPGTGALALTGYAPSRPSGLQIVGYAPTISVSAGALEIPVPAGSAAITGHAPTVLVTNNIVIEVPAGSLSVTGYAPEVRVSVTVAPATAAVVLTGHVPTIVWTDNHIRAPPAGALAITGHQPAISAGDNKIAQPSAGSLSITGYAPSVVLTANHFAAPGPGALALTGYAPTLALTAHIDVTPGTGVLVITGHAPVAQTGDSKTVQPDAASLTLTGYAPTVITTANHVAAPGAGSLVIAGLAPTAQISVNQTVQPGTGSLTITGYAPSRPSGLQLVGYAPTVIVAAVDGIEVPAGSLTITGYAPTALVSGNLVEAPPAGSLAITGHAPAIEIGITGATASLSITGYAPTVVLTAELLVQPGAGSLSITGYAPTVTSSESLIVSPGSGAVAITGYAPTVISSDILAASPGAGALVITGHAPTANISDFKFTAPGTGTLTLTGYAPNVFQPLLAAPDAGALAITTYAPTISIGTPPSAVSFACRTHIGPTIIPGFD